MGEKTKTNETTIGRIERITGGKAKILNKDTYNPIESNSIKDIIEAPEGFNPVQAVEDTNVKK